MQARAAVRHLASDLVADTACVDLAAAVAKREDVQLEYASDDGATTDMERRPALAPASRVRKEHHNTHTRRCRARLNSRFDALFDMLPRPRSGDVKHKVQILQHAVERIRGLGVENDALEMEVAVRSRKDLVRWVDGVVSGATGDAVEDVLREYVTLVCRKRGWVYAEIWESVGDAVRVVQYQVVASEWLDEVAESKLASCGVAAMKTGLAPSAHTDAFVGAAFETLRPQWTQAYPRLIRDPARARAIAEAGVRIAMAVPVHIYGGVNHVVAFYDVRDRSVESDTVALASFVATSIGNAYGAAKQKRDAAALRAQAPVATPRTPKLKSG